MEQRSDSGVSITSNQNGPPPSYEAVVALDGIRKCSNVNCPLGKTMNIDDDTCGVVDDVHKGGLTIEDMESPASNDDGILDNNDKYYGENKCNMEHLVCQRCSPNQSNHLCDCNNLIEGVVSTTNTCRNCGELFDVASDANITNCSQIDGNNKCYYNYMTTPNPNGQIMDEENPVVAEQSNVEMLNCVNNNNNNNLMGVGDELNNNNALSNDMVTITGGDDTNDDNNNNNNATANNTVVDLQQINENGIIRLDMSQIIDSTGLPTYEAAIKLEQSGYV